ncbi:PREDICTED: mannose-binding protein A-like [Lepidothrix coronata]|uniref:Mannose-binding protein A-like n=1 Tax=Lepidothrix coronata TaxID=321398 RepID=A0A6J0GKG0_9PASS|nr:PREDICTED: mannose-binding protein A-like [Lepidothrix coronata]
MKWFRYYPLFGLLPEDKSQVQPEEKMYSWTEIHCSAPAVSGSPGRDGPKGAKREPGEGLRGLESFPGKVGPPGITGVLGPQGKKGEKGEYGTLTPNLWRQVTPLETKLQVWEDELNRYKKR